MYWYVDKYSDALTLIALITCITLPHHSLLPASNRRSRAVLLIHNLTQLFILCLLSHSSICNECGAVRSASRLRLKHVKWRFHLFNLIRSPLSLGHYEHLHNSALRHGGAIDHLYPLTSLLPEPVVWLFASVCHCAICLGCVCRRIAVSR